MEILLHLVIPNYEWQPGNRRVYFLSPMNAIFATHIMDIAQKLGQLLAKQKPLVDKIEIIPYDANDVAPPFKHTIWRGLDVYYDDALHLYFIVKGDQRIPLISVTTFIGLFVPPFDEKTMATRCAQKPDYECDCLNKKEWETLDIDKRAKRIITAWKKNNKQATDYGTAAHAACEMKVKYATTPNSEIMAVTKLEYGKVSVRPIIVQYLENLQAILQPYYDLGYEFIAEPVLVNALIGMAGQADLVLVNYNTKSIVILDYKTNKVNPKLKRPFGNLEGLFSNYPHSPWYEYSLQLGMYANMLLSQNQGYKIERIVLLWLNPNTGDVEPLEIDAETWVGVIRDALNTLKTQNVFTQAYKIMNI